MSYGGSTYYWQIPYMKQGDILNEEDEQRKAQITDGLLYSATFGGSNCLLEDANYTLTGTTSSEATLTLTALGENVITALIGKRVATVEESVTVSITRGTTRYIFVRTMDDIDVDPTSCEVVALEDNIQNDGSILLAVVNYTGAIATLNTNTGKLYLTSIREHIEDTEDPHGETLTQTNLDVTTSLTVKGGAVHGCTYTDFTTNGSTGVVVNLDFNPVFVSVMPKGDAGYFYYSISGTTVTIYNSGATGVNAVARIEG